MTIDCAACTRSFAEAILSDTVLDAAANCREDDSSSCADYVKVRWIARGYRGEC